MNNSANDNLKEPLSALMDGELSRSESAFLIKRISHDPELRALWQRQCTVRDVMRNEHPVNLDFNLADRIRTAVQDEAEIVPRTASSTAASTAASVEAQSSARPVTSPSVRPWLRPLTGLAVAVSVASVAIVGWQGMQGGDSTGPALTASVDQANSSRDLWVHQGLKPGLNVQNASLKESGSERLNAYLRQHQEESMMMGAPGWMPYSSMVGSESELRRKSLDQTYIVDGQ